MACAVQSSGDVQPSAMGGVRVMRIGPEEKPRLLDLVETMADATVEELAEAFAERHGTALSR